MSHRILRGWRAIGEHLGIHHATAKEWHVRWGLPVNRSVGKRVFTSTDVIDRWILAMDRAQREYALYEYETKLPVKMPQYRTLAERARRRWAMAEVAISGGSAVRAEEKLDAGE